jgi:pimeloyl-ACP methyl ester carboxylesterase
METQARSDAITSGDGTTIRYRTFGGGGPAVVLLHGGMQTSHNFRTLAALLGDRSSRPRRVPAAAPCGTRRAPRSFPW